MFQLWLLLVNPFNWQSFLFTFTTFSCSRQMHDVCIIPRHGFILCCLFRILFTYVIKQGLKTQIGWWLIGANSFWIYFLCSWLRFYQVLLYSDNNYYFLIIIPSILCVKLYFEPDIFTTILPYLRFLQYLFKTIKKRSYRINTSKTIERVGTIIYKWCL